MVRIELCLILFVIFWMVESQEIQITTKFLKDFFDYSVNVRFIVYLCWPKRDLINFFKLIKNKEISILTNGSKMFEASTNLDNKVVRVLDLSFPGATAVLEEAHQKEYYLSPNKWLLIDFDSKFSDEILNPLEILIDSQVTMARYDNGTMILTQPYKYSRRDTEVVFEDFGYWGEEKGIIDTRKFPEAAFRRKNIQKRVITSSVVASTPNTMATLYVEKPESDALTKHSHMLNCLLMEYINATYSFTPTDSWGRVYSNGSWTGMVRKLIDREEDISGTGLFMNSLRQPYIHFMWRICKTRVIYIFRRPPLSYVSNIFTLSFQRNVWISSAMLAALVVVLVYLTVAWEMKTTDTTAEDAATVPLLQQRWSDVCLFVLGGICQQGCEVEPRGFSGRIATLFLFMSLMFLYVSYSANIVALLQATSDDIHSLRDLYDSRLQLGHYDIEYARFLRNLTDDPLQTLLNNKVGSKGYLPLAEGVRRIQKGLYSFLVEAGPCYKTVSETFKENEKCDLHEVPLSGGKFRNTYVALSKRSPYRDILTAGCFKLEESGLQQRTFTKFYVEKPKCANAAANFVMVGLIDSYLAFVVWACGAGCALFLLLVEKWLSVISFKAWKSKFKPKIWIRN